MKVAVFGDSYADEIMNKNEVNYKSWVELLREKYYPDLTCYGEAGSSLYFSYDLFLEHQSKFDKIIFVTTTSGRLTIPKYIPFKPTNINRYMYHINNMQTAQEHLMNNSMTELGIHATKAAIEYFKYLHDPLFDERMHYLIKENILEIRSDAVIVETLPPGLSAIAYYEFDPTGNRHPADMWRYRDRRMCHLSPRNNEILADKMFEWCNGTPVKIDVNDFEIPSKEELERLLVDDEFKINN
jgi:hypothetical protein